MATKMAPLSRKLKAAHLLGFGLSHTRISSDHSCMSSVEFSPYLRSGNIQIVYRTVCNRWNIFHEASSLIPDSDHGVPSRTHSPSEYIPRIRRSHVQLRREVRRYNDLRERHKFLAEQRYPIWCRVHFLSKRHHRRIAKCDHRPEQIYETDYD